MAEPQSTVGSVEYRLVIVEPQSKAIFGIERPGSRLLPRVHIAAGMRSAQQIVKAVEVEWGLKMLVLDFLSISDCESPKHKSLCVAGVRIANTRASIDLLPFRLEQLLEAELTPEEERCLQPIIDDTARNPLSNLSWIDAAIAWVEQATGDKISSKSDIEQLNACGGFALVRFCLEGGSKCWLKATGDPNKHERALTVFLAGICPESLPRLIAYKEEWNTWLTEHGGSQLPQYPSAEQMSGVARGFASLQIRTLNFISDLFANGAHDQRPQVLRGQLGAITEYLIGAMERQETTRVPPLSRDRMIELALIAERACLSMESLGIPDTLIHNDLTRSNILWDQNRCVFIDWSEAAIGNPFLACERLCQLNLEHRDRVHSVYRSLWSDRTDADSIERALVLSPLLAIFACLYGRGNWPRIAGNWPQADSYARSLARHMDRAARNPELLELLCL